MKTCDELAARWDFCHGGQILVDHTHPLKMYLNINSDGNKELLVPTEKTIASFRPTEAIGIKNYKQGNRHFFAIELLNDRLTKEYVCLCFDLIEASRPFESEKQARQKLFDVFEKWYALWNSARSGILPIHEIRGLMGEIKYIIDELNKGEPESRLIPSWTIHQDASRDFVFDDTWDEIKTIKTSGDTVTISSLEQLEHDSDGRLIVYRLDRVDEKGDNSYTLNSIIEELKNQLSIQYETELFRKLLIKGYSYSEAYDSFEFRFTKKSIYKVDASFPIISRSSISDAICSAKYEILLNRIETWRVE